MRSLLLFSAAASAHQVLQKFDDAPIKAMPPIARHSRRQEFSEPCEEVAALISTQEPKNGFFYVPAEVAHECLQSVPVDTKGDLKLVHQLKHFFQYQSNLNYLKDGIEHHNEAVDVLGELDNIANRLKDGLFKGEYDVQKAIVDMITKTRDNHLQWHPDILAVMRYQRPGASLLSVSADGLALPDIFYLDDYLQQQTFDFTPSPLTTINGEKAVDFLTKFSQQEAYHDPDALYNTLFPNSALISMGGASAGTWARPKSYPGPDTTLVFKNGTDKTFQNVAAINALFDLSNVTDGASFFAKFCTGKPLLAAEIPGSNATDTNTTAAIRENPQPVNYPVPEALHESLALQGYFMNGTSYNDIAVLAIPSFLPTPVDEEDILVEWQKVLKGFLADAVNKDKKKLIIDLRNNGGGAIVLPIDLFQQLFPTTEPFSGAKTRVHESSYIEQIVMDDLVNNDTFKEDHPELWSRARSKAGPFLYSHLRKADGSAFGSLDEYWGPYEHNGDNFTATWRYNYTDNVAGYPGLTQTRMNFTGYNSESPAPSQPFAPENIVILQDGLCSSACSMFSELMREQGNVHTISVGGRPVNEPMQGIGGTKGTRLFGMSELVGQTVEWAQLTEAVHGEFIATKFNESSLGQFLFSDEIHIRGSKTNADPLPAYVNSFDGIRENDPEEIPLEFVYEAADCKLFYTLETYSNVAKLWEMAADAKWGNGKCVEGSTGHKSSISAVNGDPFNSKQGDRTELEEFTGSASVSSFHLFRMLFAAVVAMVLLI